MPPLFRFLPCSLPTIQSILRGRVTVVNVCHQTAIAGVPSENVHAAMTWVNLGLPPRQNPALMSCVLQPEHPVRSA